ncbi:MAG: hypothetical protein ACTS9Y_00320 [Methylophilus sp.]|uniref:hypothetical protein n=1 Tax=Methylophilus sp. TaxID=29541 RepID=UPI003F9F509B
MTKVELALASKVFALANTFHSIDGMFHDLSGSEKKVRAGAMKYAFDELEALGFNPSQLMRLEECIDAVKSSKQRNSKASLLK